MADNPISIYDSMSAPQLSIKSGDTLSITFHDECEWCFEDHDDCFGGQLPKRGHHHKGDGLYKNIKPIRPGTVYYNGVHSGHHCHPHGPENAGHTITVNN
jgi:hypothetical protein